MDSKALYVLVSFNRVQQHEESLFKKQIIYLAITKCTKQQKWWIWQILVLNMEKGDNQENVAKVPYITWKFTRVWWTWDVKKEPLEGENFDKDGELSSSE